MSRAIRTKEASQHFLDGASTPPVPGGEHSRLRLISIRLHPVRLRLNHLPPIHQRFTILSQSNNTNIRDCMGTRL